ncbi:hypothetical protein BDW62DRAFT_39037 [Aspergillus aurantiobrunneus]
MDGFKALLIDYAVGLVFLSLLILAAIFPLPQPCNKGVYTLYSHLLLVKQLNWLGTLQEDISNTIIA